MTTPLPFIISREFDAPRQVLFDAHTQPQHMAKWLNPEGFRTLKTAMDLREGGSYHYGIEGPNGIQTWGKQQYLQIVRNELIVYLQSFSDPEGGLGTHPMAPTWPLYMHVSIRFEDADAGHTRLTVTWVPHESGDIGNQTFDGARAGMQAGWEGTFAKLDAYLREIQG